MGLETGPRAHNWEQQVSTCTPEIQQLVLYAPQPAAAHQTTAEGNADAENTTSFAQSQTSYSTFPAILQ